MATVTQRIKEIKQPRGGYLNPKQFTAIKFEDNIELNAEENIHSSLVGSAVDYMTRFIIGATLEKAFEISLLGASVIRQIDNAMLYLDNITGLDAQSITCACKLAGYDVCYRSGMAGYRPVEEINPDESTISNIRTMVNRSVKVLNEYGPVIKDGFTFEGGYTDLVSKGDGDFLTKEILWDMKVSGKGPTNVHTLQLLIYYLMGIHSIHKEFQTVKQLGIFNPRLNTVYLLEISNISDNIIKQVSTEVIGYPNI